MLTINPPNLKGFELFDYHIAHLQHVYKYNNHKLSAYLSCYRLTKNQSSTMNQEYPQIFQRDLMQRFWVEGYKSKYLSDEAQ